MDEEEDVEAAKPVQEDDADAPVKAAKRVRVRF